MAVYDVRIDTICNHSVYIKADSVEQARKAALEIINELQYYEHSEEHYNLNDEWNDCYQFEILLNDITEDGFMKYDVLASEVITEDGFMKYDVLASEVIADSGRE